MVTIREYMAPETEKELLENSVQVEKATSEKMSVIGRDSRTEVAAVK